MRKRPGDSDTGDITRTAAYFFFLNFAVIMFAYAFYDEGMSGGFATLAITVTTSAMFALSAVFSSIGAVKRSKVGTVAGFVGLAVSLVFVVVMMMQYVSEHSS